VCIVIELSNRELMIASLLDQTRNELFDHCECNTGFSTTPEVWTMLAKERNIKSETGFLSHSGSLN
jgi:hypothetical protein